VIEIQGFIFLFGLGIFFFIASYISVPKENNSQRQSVKEANSFVMVSSLFLN